VKLYLYEQLLAWCKPLNLKEKSTLR